MKKISIILSVLVLAALSACTLYMDEPDDAGRILRTGEGYDKEESITLPDDQGSITYKYSQKTIPINDEVEQYIVKVESDTILYFEGGTPDELLPEVGEMMTCSFRDRFPNAFCHKCIERTEQDGIYRCVFTKCSFDEAFTYLKFNITPTEAVLPEGAEYVSSEEMDSIMNQFEDTEDEPAEAREAKPETRSPFRKEFPAVKITKNITLQPTFANQSIGSINGKAHLELGGYAEVTYDTSSKELVSEWGLYGEVSFSAQVTGSFGGRFESPVAIPLIGFKADAIIVGINIGYTLSPYLEIKEECSGQVEFNQGIDIAFRYKHIGEGKGEFERIKANVKKKEGQPMFNFKVDGSASTTEMSLRIRDGEVYGIGLGEKLIFEQAEISLGGDRYTDYNFTVDSKKYQSPEDFEQKYISQPSYYELFIQASAGIFGFTGNVNFHTDPIKTVGRPRRALFPVYKKGSAYVYCSEFSPRTYKMGFELEDEGLVCAFWGSKPQLRAFEKGWNTDEPIEAFQMDWDKGSDYKKSTATKRSKNLLNNIQYIGNVVMVVKMPNYQYAIPIVDIPFITEVPQISIFQYETKAVQTLTPANGTAQELSNPTVIARKGDKLAWVYKGEAYLYRFKIDVPVALQGLRLIEKWGIQMGDKYSNTSNFSHKEGSSDTYKEYTVRMTWYANQPSVYLYFQPWADTQDAKGNKGGKLKFQMEEITATYSASLDKQFSITAESPDFEYSRITIPEIWNVKAVDLPFGEHAVLGEVEILPMD